MAIKKRHVAALIFEIIGTLAIINPFHSNLNMLGGIVGAAIYPVVFSVRGYGKAEVC